MKILGIDPGTTRIGYGVITSHKGKQVVEDFGCINLEAIDPLERLYILGERVEALINKECPERIALESVFFSKNKKTALLVSEARGVIKYIALKKRTPLYEYTPTQVKQAISTHGTASKKEVQKMVQLLLHLPELPTPDDVADALAVALCASAYTWQEGQGLDP